MKKFIIAIVLLSLFVRCGKDITQSQEEIEYQQFVTTVTNNLSRSKLSPMERSKAFDQTYSECGLQEFIYGKGDYVNKGDKSLTDLDEFYDQIIIGKYSNSESLDGLRIKFINYAVSAFNLTQLENAESIQHLIKYTRELMKNYGGVDAALTYKCISSIRGLIETEEYNEMVKKAKFQVRLSTESMQHTLASRKVSEPNEPYDQLKKMIETNKRYLSDFEALKISWTGSDK